MILRHYQYQPSPTPLQREHISEYYSYHIQCLHHQHSLQACHQDHPSLASYIMQSRIFKTTLRSLLLLGLFSEITAIFTSFTIKWFHFAEESLVKMLEVQSLLLMSLSLIEIIMLFSEKLYWKTPLVVIATSELISITFIVLQITHNFTIQFLRSAYRKWCLVLF